MANIDLITATVQQLLNQTSALLKQDGAVVIQDETLANLERDTQLAMMQLRRCRNDSIVVPINRLPPELLHIIFGGLRHPPSPRLSRQLSISRFNSYRSLISAMLVCHKWHVLASQAASLWTDIDFAHQGAFAPVLLTRSLGATIRLCGRVDEDNTLRKVIADHGARIEELDLWVKPNLSHPVPMLRSIFAVDMPRVRILSLSYEGSDGTEEVSPVITVTDSDTSEPFSALQAMLLESFLFVPAHPLPRLTHLYLAWLHDVDPSSILSLLRNAPALEVFDMIQCREFTPRPNSAPSPSFPVVLPRLHTVHILRLTSTTVHDLMTRIEAPALASLCLSSIIARNGALVATPLIPSTLAARTAIDRLAVDVGGRFSFFRTVFHGPDLALAIGINAAHVQEAECVSWAFDDLPAVLPLSHVEELHFQATEWGNYDNDNNNDDDTDVSGPHDLLVHLAARTPLVSTLLLKHNAPVGPIRDEDADVLLDLARAVGVFLGLFPRLAHLELIVNEVYTEFCEALVPALAQRARDGRRLRTLRIVIDERHALRWSMGWRHHAPPDFAEEAGMREYVDDVEIAEKRRQFTAAAGGGGDDGDGQRTNTLGWGQWKNYVQHAQHGYWRGITPRKSAVR